MVCTGHIFVTRRYILLSERALKTEEKNIQVWEIETGQYRFMTMHDSAQQDAKSELRKFIKSLNFCA